MLERFVGISDRREPEQPIHGGEVVRRVAPPDAPAWCASAHLPEPQPRFLYDSDDLREGSVNELGSELDRAFGRVVRHDAAAEAIPCLEHQDARARGGEFAR